MLERGQGYQGLVGVVWIENMEESELEEGEACSYNLTNDFGSTFDPDNDLSYIVRLIPFS